MFFRIFHLPNTQVLPFGRPIAYVFPRVNRELLVNPADTKDNYEDLQIEHLFTLFFNFFKLKNNNIFNIYQ
jgi:hypothetical protein